MSFCECYWTMKKSWPENLNHTRGLEFWCNGLQGYSDSINGTNNNHTIIIIKYKLYFITVISTGIDGISISGKICGTSSIESLLYIQSRYESDFYVIWVLFYGTLLNQSCSWLWLLLQIAEICQQTGADLNVSSPALLSTALNSALEAAKDASTVSLIKGIATRAMQEAQYISTGQKRSIFLA